MRELIYLSEGKLREFRPDKPSESWWRRIRGFGGQAPMGMGGVQVTLSEKSAAEHPDLAQVLRHIDASGGPPKWVTDEDLQPGEWVRFKTRLNVNVVASDSKPKSAALLFWEPPQPDAAAGPLRLLLHGSPEHLLGRARGGQPTQMVTLPMTAAATLVEFLRSLTNEPMSGAVAFLLDELDSTLPPELASGMSGYARVTAALAATGETPRVVLASPLFVERTPV